MTEMNETRRNDIMFPRAMLRSVSVPVIQAGTVVLSGCAANTSLVKEEDVTIERVDSHNARISRAYLRTSDAAMVSRGELQRRFPGRGPIPGHLHIGLVAEDGAAFKEAVFGYKRMSVRSRVAKFHIEIPGMPSDMKIVRVIHHDARSHMSDLTKSPWRDASQIN